VPSESPSLWKYLLLIPLGIYLLGWGVLVHQGSWASAWVGGFLGLVLVAATLCAAEKGTGPSG